MSWQYFVSHSRNLPHSCGGGCHEYANTTLNELIKEAEQSDNRLALAITERFEEELEQSEQQKSTIRDEVNKYVVQDIPEFGKYFANLIENIIEDKGAKRKTKQHIVDFVNAVENDFSPETREAFGGVLGDIERLL